jgi:HK97 family phage prohead protease
MNAKFPDGTEQRAAPIEFRSVGRRLTGHAAVFNTPATIGGFTETIRAGAVRDSLSSNPDILALVDHNPSALLGRTKSGTLRLSEDSRGLAFEIDVPNTQLGNDVLAMAARGDLGGMSFGFRVAPQGDHWNAAGDQRELRSVGLVEVSVVHAFPAYAQTTVSARARHLGRALADARIRALWLESL